MSEEERLSIAKESIEFILKTYQVEIGYDDSYDEIVIYINHNFKKRVSIDNV